MLKPITNKQTNKFLPDYGKYISRLFGLEVIGDSKQEAEQYLYSLIEWNMQQFQKVYQYNNLVFILKRDQYRINSYTYARMENGLEQGITSFKAANNREAQHMAEQWFYSSVESITA